MDFVVGAFPFEQWARDVEADLKAEGIGADVFYAGPRAFQVVVDEADSERAGEVLAGIGYLACSSRGASLSGVFDWFPGEEPILKFEELGEEAEELRDEIGYRISKKIGQMADVNAAMTWSTPTDDLEDAWVVASFGDAYAVNGDLMDQVQNPPKGYVLSNKGGDVPVVEEHVYMEHVLRAVEKEFSVEHRPAVVKAVIADIWKKGYKSAQEVSWSVSGETEIYVREKEDDDEE